MNKERKIKKREKQKKRDKEKEGEKEKIQIVSISTTGKYIK